MDTERAPAAGVSPAAASEARGADLELAIVLGRFEARTGREADLAAVLAAYVVLTRRQSGCRNVDLVSSAVQPGRLVVIEKWESAERARAHLDAPETVAMAESAVDLLAAPPDLDLYDAVSAYDLE